MCYQFIRILYVSLQPTMEHGKQNAICNNVNSKKQIKVANRENGTKKKNAITLATATPPTCTIETKQSDNENKIN